MKHRNFLFILISFFTFPMNSFAEETILITADRILTPIEKATNGTLVITSDQLKKIPQKSVEDILRSHSDLQIATSGSQGNTSSIFMRGTDASHTLVLIDGIIINDPSNPNRQFDFSKISSNNIERIEIIKGSQGLLFGSNAIGGVISITSKKRIDSQERSLIETSYGSFNSKHASFSHGEKILQQNIVWGIEVNQNDGFSTNTDPSHPNDSDGNQKLATNLGINGKFNNQFNYDFKIHFLTDKVDLDKGASHDDPNYQSKSQEIFSKLSINSFWSESIQSELQFSSTRYLRRTYDPKDTFQTYDSSSFSKGDNFQLSFDNIITANEIYTQKINLTHQYETDANHHNNNTSLFLYNRADFSQTSFDIGLRLDQNEIFNSHLTYKLGLALAYQPFTYHISHSTGFRAPSLNQLFATGGVGNVHLTPEESQSFEMGQTFSNGEVENNFNLYLIKINNRFSYLPSTFQNINSGTAMTKGLEESLKWSTNKDWNHLFRFNLNESFNQNDNTRLPRRPEISLSYNLEFTRDVHQFILENIYHGKSYDVDDNGNLSKTLAKYFIHHFYYHYALNKNSTASLKIKNLFNTHYEEVWGYNTGGRDATISYSLKF